MSISNLSQKKSKNPLKIDKCSRNRDFGFVDPAEAEPELETRGIIIIDRFEHDNFQIWKSLFELSLACPQDSRAALPRFARPGGIGSYMPSLWARVLIISIQKSLL